MTPNLCISWLFAPSHDSQIFCILLMFLAAVIFGGLIGELQVQYQLPFMICMEFSFVCDIPAGYYELHDLGVGFSLLIFLCLDGSAGLVCDRQNSEP